MEITGSFVTSEVSKVCICPCCGFRFEGSLKAGCSACGAQAVGEPLPQPEHLLPAYGRSLLLVVTGTLMVLVFLAQTIVSLLQRIPLSFDLWSWVAAAQTAAWRLKWVAIPISIIVLWGGTRIYRSMLQTPARFCGLRYARSGLMASALVVLLIATLIGVTVPERLQQHREAIEAAFHAQGYTIDRALLEYRTRYGTLPTDLKDLTERLPDPDGSIAAALATVDPTAYKTSSELASADVQALRKAKQHTLRGAVLRNASTNAVADDTVDTGFAFTNYELQLPGADKILGTEDDWIVRDGVITRAPQPVRTAAGVPVLKP